MSYKTSTIWAKSLSYGGTRSESAVKYIVIHYTGNTTDTARANANYFGASGSNTRKAGAHYFVDENNVVQSVSEKRIAWSVGGGKYSNTAQTGGGRLYGVVTNGNSISIEMCSRNGAIAQDTIDNTILLTRQLMKKYGIAADHVVRHFDVNGKDCPGWSGWTGSSNAKWVAFKKKLSEQKITAVTTEKTALRLAAGKKNEAVGELNGGVKLTIEEETQNWYRTLLWVPRKSCDIDGDELETTEECSLRTKSGKSNERVGTLKAGARRRIFKRTDNWAQISLWLPKKYCRTE